MRLQAKLFNTIVLCAIALIVMILHFISYSQFTHLPQKFNTNLFAQKPFVDNRITGLDSGNHYETVEVWQASVDETVVEDSAAHRPHTPSFSKFKAKSDYMKQVLVADYAKGAEKVYLMVKEGSNVMWERMPVHMFTTLTRMPHFALYSDVEGSMGGHVIHNALAGLSEEYLQRGDFEQYRLQQYIRLGRTGHDYTKMKVNNGWELDKYKNIPMLRHAYENAPKEVEWFIMIDGDSYVFMDTLLELLKKYDPTQPWYFGSAVMLGHLDFAHGGSGIVLSRKAVEMSVGEHPEWIKDMEKPTSESCCGDAIVAQMLKDKMDLSFSNALSDSFQGNSLHDVDINPRLWCKKLATFHHLSPKDIEVLWEYERARGPKQRGQITYAQFYKDFYEPYIDNKREDWDNFAREFEYTLGKDLDEGISTKDRPYQSFENCKKACEDNESCLMFRYFPKTAYCGGASYVKLGKSVHDKIDFPRDDDDNIDNTGAQSGWMVDRIRDMRSHQSCDVVSQQGKDGTEHTEGWWLRDTKYNEQALQFRNTENT